MAQRGAQTGRVAGGAVAECGGEGVAPAGREHARMRPCLVILAALWSVYLLQMASPLRLTGDAVVYFSMAQSAMEGRGFVVQASPTHFPAGFPALIVALDRLGLARPWAFVGLNCLLMGAGLAAVYGVLRAGLDLGRPAATALCCLAMLSYPFFKYVALPLSDIPFFGLAMPCVLAAVLAERSGGAKRVVWAGLAALLAAGAIKMRTAGMALLPAVLWGASGGSDGLRSALQAGRRRPAVLATVTAAIVLAAAAACLAVTRTAYFREMKAWYAARGPLGVAVTLARHRLTEWGQIATNMPYTQAPGLLRAVFPFLGALVAAVAALGLWGRRRAFCAADLYVLAHAGIALLWPYWDPRFWLPIIPLLMAAIGRTLWGLLRARAVRRTFLAYLALFALTGVVGLAYNTRISLSGRRFPEFYHYPGLDATYRVAWGYDIGAGEQQVNPAALRALRRFEPRAARRED